MILVNGKPIQAFNFPGGECQVNIDAIHSITFLDLVIVHAFLNNSDKIMQLLLTVDAIHRRFNDREIHLHIIYFPYSRQDRVCNQGESFSLKIMADLINYLKCRKVFIYDPHSDVTPALLDNCIVIPLHELIDWNRIIKPDWVLIAPDAGAEKKVRKFSNHFPNRIVTATKVRDPKTGDINLTKLNDNVKDEKVLILDDICDGGATFINLARILQDNGIKEMRLFVTHGIFSKGLSPLFKYFDEIYCYHTFLKKDDEHFQKLKILGANLWN